jgi:hypothetical protein
MKERADIWTRVNSEVQAGRLWRAKEILQGSIRSKYDPRVFERYGQILLLMRDNVEAGKYLFLSGSRKPEYEEAITLFTKRFGASLYFTFPRSARFAVPEKYPAAVVEDLGQLGVTLLPKSCLPWRRASRTWVEWLINWGCSFLVAIALMLMVLGVVFVVRLFVK